MKRTIASLLVLVFLFSFVGCKDKESKSEAPSGAESSTVAGKGKEATKESKKDKKSKDKSSGNDVDESTSKGADKDDASKKESASEKDASSKKEDSKSSSTSSTTKGSGSSSGTKDTTKGSGSTTAKSGSTTTTKKSGSSTTTTKKTTTTTAADANDILRKQIESTYGVRVFYGNEQVLIDGYYMDYPPGGYTPEKLTDSDKIKTSLNSLNTVLSTYPSGFFKDFKNNGMPLTFYLIDNVGGAFTGLSDASLMSNIIVTLTYSKYGVEHTANHELMHCIDYYLEIVMYPSTPYEAMNSLNPSGFQYGNNTSAYLQYCAGTTPAPTGANIYFVSDYAMTNPKEDRAEIFKYMTRTSYIPSNIMTKQSPTYSKALLIESQIKQYFPSASSGLSTWNARKAALS